MHNAGRYKIHNTCGNRATHAMYICIQFFSPTKISTATPRQADVMAIASNVVFYITKMYEKYYNSANLYKIL